MPHAALPVSGNLTPLKNGDYDPRAMAINFDFGAATIYAGDFLAASEDNELQFVQAVYIDNMDNGSNTVLTVLGSGQRITALPYTQGTYPVIGITPMNYTITSTGGVVVPVQFLNYPTPFFVWGKDTINAGGGGGALPVNPVQNVTWTLTKVVLDGSANQAGLAANPARKAWKISAYSGNAAPVGYSFDNHATAALSCPELTPAGSDQSGDISSTQALTLFGTAADIVWINEGT